jgi:NADH:ubiquinone oxidoreductase subunit E
VNALMQKFPREVEAILAKYPAGQKRPAVLDLLRLAQKDGNSVSVQAVREIAALLGISATEVTSIAGFYTLFHEEGGGRYRIQVCTDLPCAIQGSEEFLHGLCTHLGVEPGGTTDDGLFTIEEVKCLAACHRAPVFQLQAAGGELRYHENQTLESAVELIEEIRRGASLQQEESS